MLEKNATAGGRAQQLVAEGFTYDMGPSWYWMPDVFERFFNQFGKKVSDYYSLIRLNPSYRVYWKEGYTDIPADYEELKKIFENFEKGAGSQLDKYLHEASPSAEYSTHAPSHKAVPQSSISNATLKLNVGAVMPVKLKQGEYRYDNSLSL